MAWNLQELMSRTTQALGARSEIAASDVSFWVNTAQDILISQLPQEELESIAVSSTTVNEGTLAKPSDFGELIYLSNTSTGNPTLLDPINMDQIGAFSDNSGSPTHYAEYATGFLIRPVPDSAYSLELRYTAQHSEMTALTSVPSVSTRYRPGIFYKAAELMAENVTFDDARAVKNHQLYVSFMGSIPSQQALRMRNNHALGCSLGRTRGEKRRFSSTSFDRRID